MLSIVKEREFSAGFEKALRARGITHRRAMSIGGLQSEQQRWRDYGYDRIDIDCRLFIRCGIFAGDLERIAGHSKRVKKR